jgi:hypothetical protein
MRRSRAPGPLTPGFSVRPNVSADPIRRVPIWDDVNVKANAEAGPCRSRRQAAARRVESGNGRL